MVEAVEVDTSLQREASRTDTPETSEIVAALKSEVARLREEKRLAGEIFSETICDYEEEVRSLKKQLAAARQQLQSRSSSNSRVPLRLFSRASQLKGGSSPRKAREEGGASEAADSSIDGESTNRTKRSVILGEAPKTGQPADFLSGAGVKSRFERGTHRSTKVKEAESSRQSRGSRSPSEKAKMQKQASGEHSGDALSSQPLLRGERVSVSKNLRVGSLASERSSSSALKALHANGLGGGRASSLWISVLADWQSHLKSPRFKALLRMGVPHDVRGEVWKRAVPDSLNITPHFYELLVRRVKNARRHLLRTSPKYRERVEAIGGLGSWTEDTGTNAIQNGASEAPLGCAASSSSTARSDLSAASDAPQLAPTSAESRNGSEQQQQQGQQQQGQQEQELTRQQSCSGRLNGCGLRCEAEDAGSSCCSCGCFFWEQEVFASFLTLSADLHRTLPRLGMNSGGASSSCRTSRAVVSPETRPMACCAEAEAETDEAEFGGRAVAETGREEASSQGLASDTLADSPPPSQRVPPVPFGVASEERMEVFLRNVLEVYVMLRPDQGYVQGMAFIAATLLMYMEEYSAFVCFANLMMRPSLRAFYAFDMAEVAVYFRTFDCLLEEKLPHVFQHWTKLGIETDFFLVEWMYTLFTRCLPFELLTRVWDLLLIEGDVVLFQTSLAMVSYFQTELQQQSLDECMALLSPSTTTHFKAMETERFLNILQNLRLTPQRVDALMKTVRESLAERRRRERTGLRLPFCSLKRQDGEGSLASVGGSSARTDPTHYPIRQSTTQAAYRSIRRERETPPLRMTASEELTSLKPVPSDGMHFSQSDLSLADEPSTAEDAKQKRANSSSYVHWQKTSFDETGNCGGELSACEEQTPPLEDNGALRRRSRSWNGAEEGK